MNATTTLTATIETFDLGNGYHVSTSARLQVRATVAVINETGTVTSLDDAERLLRETYEGWFVYRGGNHVALHRASGGKRVLLIEERKVEVDVRDAFVGIEGGKLVAYIASAPAVVVDDALLDALLDAGCICSSSVDYPLEYTQDVEVLKLVARLTGNPLQLPEAPAPVVTTPVTFAAIKAAVTTERKAARAEAEAHRRGLNADLNKARRRGERVVRYGFIRSRGQRFTSLDTTGGRGGAFEESGDWDGTKGDLLNAIGACMADPRTESLDLSGGFDISETIDFDDYEPEVSYWSVTVWTRAEGMVCKANARS
jgi:hypothetical protein